MAERSTQGRELTGIPGLAEVVEKAADVPVLTEIIAEEYLALNAQTEAPEPRLEPELEFKPDPKPVVPQAEECQRLADAIAPQLENLLHENMAQAMTEEFAVRFETLWQQAWREVLPSLGGLIRAQLTGGQFAAAQFAAEGAPAEESAPTVGIISSFLAEAEFPLCRHQSVWLRRDAGDTMSPSRRETVRAAGRAAARPGLGGPDLFQPSHYYFPSKSRSV